MRCSSRCLWLLVTVALLTGAALFPCTVFGDPAPADDPPPQLTADTELLRRTMVDNPVETALPRPGVSLWVRDAALAFSRWFAGLLEFFLPGLARQVSWLSGPALKLLVGILSLLLAGFLIRFLWARWQRLEPPSAAVVRRLPAAADAPAVPSAFWESELRRHLEARDVRSAIEALWWWLASTLVPAGPQPSWTSRELLVAANRRDLMPRVRRLDRMIYGSEHPSAVEVKRLWSDLREDLA